MRAASRELKQAQTAVEGTGVVSTRVVSSGPGRGTVRRTAAAGSACKRAAPPVLLTAARSTASRTAAAGGARRRAAPRQLLVAARRTASRTTGAGGVCKRAASPQLSKTARSTASRTAAAGGANTQTALSPSQKLQGVCSATYLHGGGKRAPPRPPPPEGAQMSGLYKRWPGIERGGAG